MALLSRYGHVQPSESDALTQPQALQLLKAVDELVVADRKHLQDLILGAAEVIAKTLVAAVSARG